MKINEVEAAVGVTKKNIRFYSSIASLLLSLKHYSFSMKRPGLALLC